MKQNLPPVIMDELGQVITSDVMQLGVCGIGAEVHDEQVRIQWRASVIEIEPCRVDNDLDVSWWRLPAIFSKCESVTISLDNDVKLVEAKGTYDNFPLTIRIYLGPKNV